MSLVSVVLPTYRRPHFLVESLASVLGQSHEELEVVVCDNAGQRETADVVNSFDDPRVVYVSREVDLGMVASVYDGLRRSSGVYVMKLDDDDVMRPDCLATLSRALDDDPELDVAGSDLEFIDETGTPLPDVHRERASLTGRDMMTEGVIRPFTSAAVRGSLDMVSALIRRTALDWAVIDERAATAYDLHLMLTAARGGRGAWYTDRRLVAYRRHGASDTVMHAERQHRGAVFTLQAAIEGGGHEDVGALRSGLTAASVMLARDLVRQGRAAEARDALRAPGVVRTDPRVIKVRGLAALPRPISTSVARRRARRGSTPSS